MNLNDIAYYAGIILLILTVFGLLTIAALAIWYVVQKIYGLVLQVTRANKRIRHEKETEHAKLLGERDRITKERMDAARELTTAQQAAEEAKKALEKRRIELDAEIKATERQSRRGALGLPSDAPPLGLGAMPSNEALAALTKAIADGRQATVDAVHSEIQRLLSSMPERPEAVDDQDEGDADLTGRRHEEIIQALERIGQDVATTHSRIDGLVDVLDELFRHRRTMTGTQDGGSAVPAPQTMVHGLGDGRVTGS